MTRTYLARLCGFWFEGDATRTLRVFSVLYSAVVLEEIVGVWIPSFDVAFAPDAVFRTTPYADHAGAWNVLGYLHSVAALAIALGVLMLALVLTIAGRWQRLAMFTSFYLLSCFHHLSPAIFFSNHATLRYFGFMLLFAPDFRAPRSNGVPVLRLIQLRVVLIYLYAFLFKALDVSWIRGDAVLLALQTGGWGETTLAHWMTDRPLPQLVFALLDRAVLVGEAFVGVGLLFRATRYYAVAAGVLMHTGLFFGLNIAGFQELMIVSLSAFVRWPDPKRRGLTSQLEALPVPVLREDAQGPMRWLRRWTQPREAMINDSDA